jgi:hypothetical protein
MGNFWDEFVELAGNSEPSPPPKPLKAGDEWKGCRPPTEKEVQRMKELGLLPPCKEYKTHPAVDTKQRK